MAVPIFTCIHMTTRDPLALILFDAIAAHLKETGDWPASGASCEVALAVLAPAIKNLVAVVAELQD